MTTVRELVDELVAFARAESVAPLLACAPYLEALGGEFGDRAPKDVSARELGAFHHAASPELTAPVLATVADKAGRWEAIYASRSDRLLGCLPWESDRAVGALVELLDRPGFRPATVLELGCGDGVNAVFMASRGCTVTAVDISPTALEIAREKQREAGVEVNFVAGDIFGLELGSGYDFVFDRGMLHHVQVFDFERYRGLVAGALAPGGWFQLICHHVSTRPTMVLEGLYGAIGKLLGLVSGILVETGCGFTADEIREIFSEGFEVESIDRIGDDLNRPFRFESALMRRLG